MLGSFRSLVLALAPVFVVAYASPARADVTAWFSLEGGAARLRQPFENNTPAVLLTDLGVGSSPNASVVVGGLFKMMTFTRQGTDLALALRVANGGFARGNWGFAVDAGPFQRWWGANATGVVGLVTLGGPFGLQASALYEEGSNSARTFGVLFGIDFMRLTVYRTSGLDWFPNPLPPADLRAGGWLPRF